MDYVVVLSIPDDYLADDSIESACRTANDWLYDWSEGKWSVRPLSEVIAC